MGGRGGRAGGQVGEWSRREGMLWGRGGAPGASKHANPGEGLPLLTIKQRHPRHPRVLSTVDLPLFLRMDSHETQRCMPRPGGVREKEETRRGESDGV